MNKTTVTVKGNLVADPKLGYTQDQTAYCHFTIAANRSVKTDKGWDSENEGFYRFTAWGTHAERISQRLKKGQAVLATGYMRQNEYENKHGQKVTGTEFELDEIGLNVWTKTWPDGTEAGASISNTPAVSDELTDDLPF